MKIDPRTGRPAPAVDLGDAPRLIAANGWFAARTCGTEAICKTDAESFSREQHADRIEAEAQSVASNAFATSVPASMATQFQETK